MKSTISFNFRNSKRILLCLTITFVGVFSVPALAEDRCDIDYANGTDRIGRMPPVGFEAVIHDAVNRFVCGLRMGRRLHCEKRGYEHAYNLANQDFIAGCRESVSMCLRRQNVLRNLGQNLDFNTLLSRVSEAAAMDIAGATQVGNIAIANNVFEEIPCVDNPRNAGRLLCRTLVQTVDENLPSFIENGVVRVGAQVANPIQINCPVFNFER